MKLGILLLVLGLLIAGAGAYAWQYSSPTFLGYRTQEAQQFFSLGLAGIILGGGLAIGGIIIMILKR
jgi:hypothetical protein